MTSFLSCLILSVSLILSTTLSDAKDSRGICIRNCGQCKRMYGDFFLGQQCAEECLQNPGTIIPDCNNPKSLFRFLGKT